MLHAKDCTKACGAWKKLKRIYVERITASRMRLYEMPRTLPLDYEDNARAHVLEVVKTRTKLRQVGLEMDGTLYELALLRNL